jgi:predicted methyltransferase
MRAFRGLPKNGALIKFLSEPGNRVKLQKSENYYLADQQKQMPMVDAGALLHIDEKNNQVELTDKGLNLITRNPVKTLNSLYCLILQQRSAEIEKDRPERRRKIAAQRKSDE